MKLKFHYFLMMALGAALPAQAVPLSPETVASLDPAARTRGTWEPFAAAPPVRPHAAVKVRLSAGETVQLDILVILVDFLDRPADPSLHPPEYFEHLLFSRGAHPTGSMADYYFENSNGRLIMNGQVSGWYRMPQRLDTYVSGGFGVGPYPNNSQGLARDAVQAADPDVNYALFDNDGPDGVADTGDDDREVDLLLVVHAGPGGESGGGQDNLRSVAWLLPSPISVDGVFANTFALGPELGNIGVFAHEIGHLLGLPDLYDASGGSFGLGTWSLMAGGWSLNLARTPAHLDAWSKIHLGFILPVNVWPTLEGAVMDPVEEGGTVYRLSANGAIGSEYFLVENRAGIGFDAFLPGEGLLVYHVDEGAPNNNLPTRYKVGLEQADGLFQLENFFGNPGFGDEGDPYTEDSPSGGFGRFTVPSSRDNRGFDTGVTVYRIQGPDASRRMTASFRTVRGPTILFTSVDVVHVDGDGDRFIEPGETIELDPALTVEAGTAHDVAMELVSQDPLAEVESGRILLGDLPVGVNHPAERIRLTIGDSPARDPYALNLALRVEYREEIARQKVLTLPVGSVEGLSADFQTSPGGFSHGPARMGFSDAWRFEVDGGNGGGRSWRCGNSAGGFPARTDAELTTPLFIIPPAGRLLFDHLVDIPRTDRGLAVAGAVVEISVNGSDWTQIAPVNGYDLRFASLDPEYNNRNVFSGASTSPEWGTEVFDLSGFAGGAVVRFRLFSGERLLSGGWTIDNVRVEQAETPVRLSRLSAVREPSGVRVSWSLTDEVDLLGIALGRASGPPAAFLPLTPGLLAATPEGEYLDVHAAPDVEYIYRLEGMGRDGSRTELGRIRAPAGAGGPERIAVFPNPVRSGAAFAFRLPAASAATITLFDAAGRRLGEVMNAVLEGGDHLVPWAGTGPDRRPLTDGVYFYRLEAAGVSLTGRLVVAR